ncbi:hypothetical protein B0H11DRAFT_784811 [Mycena galericulata]|nr:hypothetical protein B0H11DRAFT_784811 [Mycena galericulata]
MKETAGSLSLKLNGQARHVHIIPRHMSSHSVTSDQPKYSTLQTKDPPHQTSDVSMSGIRREQPNWQKVLCCRTSRIEPMSLGWPGLSWEIWSTMDKPLFNFEEKICFDAVCGDGVYLSICRDLSTIVGYPRCSASCCERMLCMRLCGFLSDCTGA